MRLRCMAGKSWGRWSRTAKSGARVANVATEFTTPYDLQIGTLKLPKGAYSIWTVPGQMEWTLIVNKEKLASFT